MTGEGKALALKDNKSQIRYGPACMALQNYYSQADRTQLEDIKSYCLNYMVSGKNLKIIYFKVMRVEVNNKLVALVFRTLPSEYQRYAEYRYKHNQKLVYISLKLNVAISQLGKWDFCILKKLKNYMRFRIRWNDAYNQVLVLNMIDILTEMINVFKQFDNENEVVNPYYLDDLIYRREQYVQLSFILNDYIRNKDVNIHNRLIYEQIMHPLVSQTKLAIMCHCDKSVISRNLKKFHEKINKYIL